MDRIADFYDATARQLVRRDTSRARLAHRAGLKGLASNDALSNALRRRTTAWAAAGLSLQLDVNHLEFNADVSPSAELTVVTGVPREFQRRLIDSLTRAARDVVQSHAESRLAIKDLRNLTHEMAELTTALKMEPASISKTKHLEPAIAWAAKRLAKARETLRTTIHETRILLAIVEEAANTSALPPPNSRTPASRRRSTKARKPAPRTRVHKGGTSTKLPARRSAPPAAAAHSRSDALEDFQP